MNPINVDVLDRVGIAMVLKMMRKLDNNMNKLKKVVLVFHKIIPFDQKNSLIIKLLVDINFPSTVEAKNIKAP